MKRLEQNVLVQVDTASKTVESHYKRVTATRNARQYAESALNVEQKRLQEGVVPSFQVMETQRRLTTARWAEIRALADYNKALSQFAYSEGTTLERNSIRLEFK